MFYHFVVIVLAASYASAHDFQKKPGRDVTLTVRKTLECVVEVLKKDFEPWKEELLSVDFRIFNNTFIKGSLELTDVKIEGATNLKIEHLKSAIIYLPLRLATEYGFTFEKITLVTNYEIAGKLMGLIDLASKGNITLGLDHLNLDGNIDVRQRKAIEITEFGIVLKLGGLDFVITGLFNDDNLSAKLSQFVSEKAVTFLEENQKLISQTIKDFVMDLLGRKPGLKVTKAVLDDIKGCLPKLLQNL